MEATTVYTSAPGWLYGRLLCLGVLTVIAVLGVVSSITDASRSIGPIILSGNLVWAWYVIVTMPYEVRFESCDVVFSSISRETNIALSEIGAIEPALTGDFIVRHTRGTVILSRIFGPALREIVARLESPNPDI
jgi:hypothetical protein